MSAVGPEEAESACARFDGPWSEDTPPLLGDANECGLLEGIDSLGEMYDGLVNTSLVGKKRFYHYFKLLVRHGRVVGGHSHCQCV